ncbi:MAG: topoisomerase DNA-binding C4 zinc finger domain-containing protein [Firmicutes bacterium]|nr:topoisomerase DNA-binding C4 zinc finger domain-containing protein [Bacillota bacterium]
MLGNKLGEQKRNFRSKGRRGHGGGSVSNFVEPRTCPRCGKPLKKRSGRFGEFYGCQGFPTCRYTENVKR